MKDVQFYVVRLANSVLLHTLPQLGMIGGYDMYMII